MFCGIQLFLNYFRLLMQTRGRRYWWIFTKWRTISTTSYRLIWHDFLFFFIVGKWFKCTLFGKRARYRSCKAGFRPGIIALVRLLLTTFIFLILTLESMIFQLYTYFHNYPNSQLKSISYRSDITEYQAYLTSPLAYRRVEWPIRLPFISGF